MIVKAAVARQAHALSIADLELDEPRAGEILVRLIASGVAQADLDALADGRPVPFPFVGGGEGAGIVERVGAGIEDFVAGDTVVLTPAFCGHCSACLDGTPALCAERDTLNASGLRADGTAPFVADGLPVRGFFQGQSSFATHALCRVASAVKVPAESPLEILACLGGELRAAASAVIAHAREGVDSIVITGAGATGLVATMAAHALGLATIIVADPSADRRALASELGATMTAHTDDDLAAVVMSLTGTGARFALETTGHPLAIEACVASLAPGRLCGLLRTPTYREQSVDAMAFEAREMVEMSHGCGSPHAVVQTMVAWHAEGRLPIDRIVAFFPFEHITDAFAALASDAVVKPVVRFSLGPFADLDRAGAEGAGADVPEDVVDDAPDPRGETVTVPG